MTRLSLSPVEGDGDERTPAPDGAGAVNSSPYMAENVHAAHPAHLEHRFATLLVDLPEEYLAKAEEGNVDFVKERIEARMRILRAGHESKLPLDAIERAFKELRGLRLVAKILTGNTGSEATA